MCVRNRAQNRSPDFCKAISKATSLTVDFCHFQASHVSLDLLQVTARSLTPPRASHARARSPTRFFSFAHTIRSLWASTCSWTLLSCRPPPVCARSPQPAVVALAHTSAPRTHRARQQGSGRALSRSIRSPHTPLLRSHTARLHARPQLPAWPLPQRRTAEADPRHPLLHFNTALTSTLPHTHGPPLRTACPPFAPAMAPIGLPLSYDTVGNLI